MKNVKQHNDGMIGLHESMGVIHAAVVRRGLGDEVEVVARHQVDVLSGDRAEAMSRLMGMLVQDQRKLPMISVVNDGRSLHKQVVLPENIDAGTAEKMLGVQMESMFPGQVDQIRWGWERGNRSGVGHAISKTDGEGNASKKGAWVYAVRRGVLEALQKRYGAGVTLQGAISGEMALGGLAMVSGTRHLGAGHDESVLIVWRHESGVSLMVVGVDGVESMARVDRGLDENDFKDEVDEAWHDVVGKLPNVNRPKHVVIVDADASGDLSDGLAEKWGMKRVAIKEVFGAMADSLKDGDELLCVGAATAGLLDIGAVVYLAHDDGKERTIKRLKRWSMVAALWCVLGCGLLYGLDYRASSALDRWRDDVTSEASVLDDDSARSVMNQKIDRQIALGRYLETFGPTPLAILDEISQLTTGFQIDEWHYDISGSMEIVGVMRGTDQVSKLVADLAKAKTLAAVRLKTQKQIGRDKTQYEIVAQPSVRYLGAFVSPKTETKHERKEKADHPRTKKKKEKEVNAEKKDRNESKVKTLEEKIVVPTTQPSALDMKNKEKTATVEAEKNKAEKQAIEAKTRAAIRSKS